MVRQAKELGLNAPFMSGDGSIDPKFIEIAGSKEAEGTYMTFSPDPQNIPTARNLSKDTRRNMVNWVLIQYMHMMHQISCLQRLRRLTALKAK